VDRRRDPLRSRSPQRLLGTQEIILIHHTDCGMLTFTDDEFKRSIQDEGRRQGPRWAAESFPDLDEDVRQSIARIKASPFHPEEGTPVRGFVYEVESGPAARGQRLSLHRCLAATFRCPAASRANDSQRRGLRGGGEPALSAAPSGPSFDARSLILVARARAGHEPRPPS